MSFKHLIFSFKTFSFEKLKIEPILTEKSAPDNRGSFSTSVQCGTVYILPFAYMHVLILRPKILQKGR